ncbi:MAG: hypothetical protein V5A55_14920 [Halovenus sp.]
MALLTDERAQSIQIGAVLVFGILIIFLAIWQAFVVPTQNEEIEFDHNQAVQQELTELRGVVNSMPDAASTRSTTVALGVRYPSRTIFVNPGPTSGTLRTVGTTDESVNITFDNITAEGNVGDFWDDPGPYNTGFISYEPNYNLYSNAPETVFENSLLYNDFGDSTGERNVLSLTGQSLVDGDRISVVALNGSFSAGRTGAVSVDLRPVSTQTRTVDIEGDGGPVTIRIPTRLDNRTWEALLEADAELVGQDGNVKRVDDGPGETVELVLRELPVDESYDLRLAKVGLGTGVTPTEAAYLTDIAGDDTTVGTDEARDVTVEVRDAFNGPVRETLVNASAARGSLTTSSPRSSGDGQVTFRYRAPSSAGADRLNFTIAEGVGPADIGGDFRAAAPENVSMTVAVTEPSTGSGGGDSAFRVDWLDPSAQNGVSCPTSPDEPCVIDGSETLTAALTMETTPTAEDAGVDYAVNDSSVGTLSRTAGTTDTNGENTTTLTVSANGTVAVFASGGGSGDRIDFRVENVAPGSTNNPPSAAIDGVTDNSRDCDRNPGGNCRMATTPTAEFDVDWSATDTDGDLTDVTLVLRDPDGNQVDSYSETFGATTSASNTITLRHDDASGFWNGDYTIELTATDANGNTDSDSATETADGD